MSMPHFTKRISCSQELFIFLVVYLIDKFKQNVVMTREEIRRENTRRLSSKIGGKAEFARFIGMEPSQLSQLIGPNPSKNIGNSISHRIEQAFDLPKGYLDVDHPQIGASTDGEPASDGREPTVAGIAARLREAMATRAIPSANALSRLVESPLPTINRVLNGTGKKAPDLQVIEELAMACMVNTRWLQTGDGPRDLVQADQGDGAEVQKVHAFDDDRDFFEIPLASGFIHAGVGADDGDLEYEEGISVPISIRWVEQKRLALSALRAVRIKGDSNYPTMKDGNIVIINTADKEIVVGEYFAVNYNLKAVVKRIERENGVWYLASDNPLPKYRRQAVEDSDTYIVGRVVKLEADFI